MQARLLGGSSLWSSGSCDLMTQVDQLSVSYFRCRVTHLHQLHVYLDLEALYVLSYLDCRTQGVVHLLPQFSYLDLGPRCGLSCFDHLYLTRYLGLFVLDSPSVSW